MTNRDAIKIFEDKKVRSVRDAEQEKWFISVVDVVSVLTGSIDGRKYWNKLKQRLKEEGNETVTICHQLKILAPDGKMRMTDAADVEQLFRLIQSIPSPRAEPFKRWLAQLGRERLEEKPGIDRLMEY
jgi:prophage antirepressor-like protein